MTDELLTLRGVAPEPAVPYGTIHCPHCGEAITVKTEAVA